MTNVLEKNIAGRTMKVEYGKVGMLSNAAIFMSYGDTVILTNVNASEKPRDGIDFFPLSVEYEERLYAVGKIPGGFIKREGRPSENAILFGRAVDRPLRPLFPKGYRNDVQVVCTVVSVEQDNLPEILAINAASMALSISSIPFTTPVAAVQIGLIDGNYVLNPTSKEREESILQLTVCATKDRVMMIEAGGDEIPEDVMIGAIEYGFEKCQEIVAFQEEAMAKLSGYFSVNSSAILSFTTSIAAFLSSLSVIHIASLIISPANSCISFASSSLGLYKTGSSFFLPNLAIASSWNATIS